MTYCDEHARIDRQSEVEQEVMVLSSDECLHIGAGVEHCQQASEGHVREERFIRMEGVQAKKALAHVHESLSDSDHEKLILSFIHGIVRCEVA